MMAESALTLLQQMAITAQLELGPLSTDLVEAVLKCCPPAALLVLKSVSKGWRACIHAMLRDSDWAARHSLPAGWMAAAHSLAHHEGLADFTQLLMQSDLNFDGAHLPALVSGAAALMVFSTSLELLDLRANAPTPWAMWVRL